MATPRRWAFNAVRLIMLGCFAFTELAGCATMGGGVDRSDACGQQHADFAGSQDYYMSETLAGAGKGMVVGAIGGAFLAAVTGGNVGQGAAIGAGTGAVVGAANGYYAARAKEARDEAALTQSIYDDVAKASTEMSHTSTTFAALKQCRYEHAALIKAQFKQGLITRDAAAAQLAEQARRFADERALAHKFGAKMADQDQSFHFAAQSLAQNDPDAQRALAAPRHGATVSNVSTPEGDFMANTAANVRKAADAGSERLTTLMPGTRVKSTGDPLENGFRKVTYNGTSVGYISDKLLSPTGGAPAPAPAPAAPEPESSDKKVAIAQNVTETIPEKRERFDKTLNDADSGSAVAFNLDQGAPPG